MVASQAVENVERYLNGYSGELQTESLRRAVELFEAQFRSRYADSRFQIDGDGYEDEDLDLNVYATGDHLELEQYAAEVSHIVRSATGVFILAFVQTDPAEPNP